MNAPWADWMAVGLAVALAAAWLGFRIRRQWRRQRDARPGEGACGSKCDDCPFSQGCGGRN